MLLYIYLFLLGTILAFNSAIKQPVNMKAMDMPISRVNAQQLRLMRMPITYASDPMIIKYDEEISGKPYDWENRENSLKSIRNMNFSYLLRYPARAELYRELLKH